MFEITTTFTRLNTSVEFFIFQTQYPELLNAQTIFRQEQSEALGFMGLNYFMSKNLLELQVQTLWESSTACNNFLDISKYSNNFYRLLEKYHAVTKIISYIEVENIPDLKYIKDKKMSSILSVAEARVRLANFINGSND